MKYTFIFFLLIIFFHTAEAQEQVRERPNIIMILTDDQRWDALGYAGNDIIHTPEMDKLARQGVYFKNAFVTTPICAASRASIITSTYERTHGFTFGTPPLTREFIEISYPYMLKQAGYRTGMFGKLGMELAGRADTVIFDELYNTGTQGYYRVIGDGYRYHVHLTDHTTDRAIDFIKNTPPDQPFCLSISYNAAHADDAHPQQYFWPERLDPLYQDVTIPKGELHQQKYHDALPDFLRDELYMGNIRYKWRYDTPEKYQKMVKGYYRLISTIDENLGRLRETLSELQIDDNTIILFMGDNGYFLAERGLAGKWLMYENSLRVPLILYDPGANGNKTVNQMALNIDIAATILDYAGVEIPSAMQGKSLKDFAYGEVRQWRENFICEHLYEIPYIPKSEGIRMERYKYFHYIDHPEVEEFYDLEKDPMETDNLIGDPAYQEILEKTREEFEREVSKL
jgi:arylsulfatase A-like enzyme